MSRDYTDVPFEIVDDGTGYDAGPAAFEARTLGGIPSPIVALLARLASGVLRGHEADALAAAAIAGGYTRNPAALRAAVEAGEPQINAFLQQIDLAAVIDAALEPNPSAGPVQLGAASLPLVGVGILGGVLLGRLFSTSDDSDADGRDDSDDD